MHDERIYKRVLLEESLGFGEAYLDDWFGAENKDKPFIRLMAGGGSSGRVVRSKIFAERPAGSFVRSITH
jgi:hypothetical protein